MGLEEVGAKLVAEGEDAFLDAFKKSNIAVSDMDRALAKLAQQEKTNSMMAELKTKLAGMSAEEKEAAINSVKLADSLDKADSVMAKTAEHNKEAADGFSEAGAKTIELNQALELFNKVMGYAEQAYNLTVGVAVKYAEQVRDLGRISGASADETSRLIQVSDDLKVEYSTLEQAAKALAQKGIALTTEELAKASDQYLSYTDAASRSEFAVKEFGRAGLEMTKILEMGGQAIKDAAAAQSGNLILTQQQVDAARNYEIAQDNLNDTLEGFKVVVGNAVIPGITQIINGFTDAMTVTDRLNASFKTSQKEAVATAKSFEEYINHLKEMGYEVDQWGNIVKATGEQSGRVMYTQVQSAKDVQYAYEDMTVAALFAKQRESDLAKTGYLSADAAEKQNEAYSQLATIMKSEVVPAVDKAQDAMVKFSVAGAMQKEIDSFNSSWTTANKTLGTTKDKLHDLMVESQKPHIPVWTGNDAEEYNKLWAAVNGTKTGVEKLSAAEKTAAEKRMAELLARRSMTTGMTQEELSEYGDLLQAQQTEEQKIREIEIAHDKATATILGNLIMQIAMQDGKLTQSELDYYTTYMKDHGLMSQADLDLYNKTYDQMGAAGLLGDAWTTAAGKGVKGAKDVTDALNAIPKVTEVEVRVKTTNTGSNTPQTPGAEPGPAAPIPGEPGWGGGGGGGARIMGSSMTAPSSSVSAPSNSFSYATYYNLSVMTSQSPAVVQRSFAIMKMLAG